MFKFLILLEINRSCCIDGFCVLLFVVCTPSSARVYMFGFFVTRHASPPPRGGRSSE